MRILQLFLVAFVLCAGNSYAQNTEATETQKEINKEEVAPLEPTPISGHSVMKSLINTFVVLAAIIATLLLITWFLKRLSTSQMRYANQNNQIKILDKRVLAKGSGIYIIEVEGKKILIGDSQSGGIHHLMDLPNIATPSKAHEEYNTQK